MKNGEVYGLCDIAMADELSVSGSLNDDLEHEALYRSEKGQYIIAHIPNDWETTYEACSVMDAARFVARYGQAQPFPDSDIIQALQSLEV